MPHLTTASNQDKAKPLALTQTGPFHFLSGHEREPDKNPSSLNVPAPLTGTHRPNVKGCWEGELQCRDGKLPT